MRAPIPKSLRFRILERDGFQCQYCGASAPDVVLNIDHVLPVSLGGKNELYNLTTACEDCNSGKRDRLVAVPLALRAEYATAAALHPVAASRYGASYLSDADGFSFLMDACIAATDLNNVGAMLIENVDWASFRSAVIAACRNDKVFQDREAFWSQFPGWNNIHGLSK